MSTAFFTLENISKYYASGQSVVMGLNNINLAFSVGEFVAITGESGSGKSTLAKVLAGIHAYENGEMYVNGKPTSHFDQSDWERYRSKSISFISQSYDILPGCSVLKNVVSSLILTGMDPASAKIQSENILRQVELWHLRKRRAAKLSSGQKQRLSIARALAKPAPILIADEPTGNLDSVNSAKVIELLATAAKERLVIIITHDFAEVAQLATRHIVIRESMVDKDVRLREDLGAPVPVGELVETPENLQTATTETATIQNSTGKSLEPEVSPTEPSPNTKSLSPTSRKKKISLSIYTARLQLGSRPVWVSIMLLFFFLTAFSMFAFLGTFVVNLDDRFTRVYDESAFYNGADNLIHVMRTDKGVMAEEDWNTLLDTKYVNKLERYGYLSEICYFYRENVDFAYYYDAAASSDGNVTGEVTRSVGLSKPSLYMQTVPLFAEETDFLTEGRLPEDMYEIVLAAEESMLGETIPVFLRYRGWAPNTYIKIDATIVGVTDFGEGLYFDERLADSLVCSMEGAKYCYGYDRDYDFTEEEITGGSVPEFTLGSLKTFTPMKERFRCSNVLYKALYESAKKSLSKDDTTPLEERIYQMGATFDNPPAGDMTAALRFAFTHDSTYHYYIQTEKAVFDTLVPENHYGNIVSLTIDDYSYTDRVLNALNKKGYTAVSPFRLGATKQDPVLAAERMQTLKVCLLSFVAVFLLQVLILRAMFSMEVDEFKLLANLGLASKTAKLSVVWQILFFTVCGQGLAFGAIYLCNHVQIKRIVDIVKYLPFTYVLIFMLIHLMTGLLTSLWIQRSMGKQIYPFSLQHTDLKMDEEV